MNLIKQSTAVTLLIGPFVDDTDGKTAETDLTISQADVRLSKNGGNMAQKNDATGCTHDELGYYTCPLNTTDTNTLGILRVMVHESGALPVWHDYQVVTANVYDTLCSTDSFDVNVTAISGDTTAADNLEAACDGTGYNIGGGDVVAASVTAGVTLANDAITAAKFDESTAFPLTYADTGATAVARTGADGDTLEDLSDEIATMQGNVTDILADTNELQTNQGNWATATGFSTHSAADVKTAIEAAGSHLTLIKAKTDNLPANPAAVGSAMTLHADYDAAKTAAQAGAKMDLVDAPNATAVTAIQNGLATAAALDAVDNFVDTEVGAIKAVTDKLDTALELDSTVYRFTTNALEQAPTGGSAPTAAAIADAVLDEAMSGHTTAGTLGKAVADILADTGTDGVQVAGIKAAALADLFDTDSGTTYASAVSGSVVKEIADNAGGSALTAGAIADAVWDEALAGHADVGSAGAGLTAAGSAGDPWATALPGSYGAGTAGKIVGDNINAPIGTVDAVVDAIKAKTDNLPASPAAVGSQMDLVNAPNATAVTAIQSGLSTLSAGDVADAVWDESTTSHTSSGTFGRLLNLLRKLLFNQQVDSGNSVENFDDDGETSLGTASWSESTGTRGKHTVAW